MKKCEQKTKAEPGSLSEETKLSFVENNKDEILSSARLSKVKAQNADSQVKVPINRGLTEHWDYANSGFTHVESEAQHHQLIEVAWLLTQ